MHVCVVAQVDEVIEMFDLRDQAASVALTARKLAEAAAVLKGSATGSTITAQQEAVLSSLLAELDRPTSIRMCVDLAVSSATGRAVSAKLLERGSQLLLGGGGGGGGAGGNGTSGGGKVETLPSLRALGPLIAKLKRGMDIVNQSACSLIVEHASPLDPEGLASRRTQAAARLRAQEALVHACAVGFADGGAGSGAAAAAAILAIEEVYSPNRAPDGGSAETPSNAPTAHYVTEFLEQLSMLTKAKAGDPFHICSLCSTSAQGGGSLAESPAGACPLRQTRTTCWQVIEQANQQAARVHVLMSWCVHAD
jgi:hypothetical protein